MRVLGRIVIFVVIALCAFAVLTLLIPARLDPGLGVMVVIALALAAGSMAVTRSLGR